MKKIFSKKIIIISLLVLLLLTLFFNGHLLVKSDVISHNESADIIILMGSLPDRTLGAYELATQFENAHIYIVKSSMNAIEVLNERGVDIKNYADLSAKALVDLGYDADKITVVEGDAKSTIDEARILRGYFKANAHNNTLTIVTSKYHSRRASWIFKSVFRDFKIDIKAHVTPYDNFDPARWFLNREDIQNVIYEDIKILHFLLFEQWQK